MPDRSGAEWDLFFVSFLSLFFELLVIRWIPSIVGPMAYFTNLTLILAFLGLGLGCLLAERPARFFNVVPLSMFSLVYAVIFFQDRPISLEDPSAVFFDYYSLVSEASKSSVSIFLIIGVLGLLTVCNFVGVGQELGRKLKHFKPLHAYSLNILGSVAGVGAFSLLAWQRCSPVLWFLCTGVAVVWLLRHEKRWAGLGAATFVAMCLLIGPTPSGVHWSPYYRIRVTPVYDPPGQGRRLAANEIDVNTLFHQFQVDLSADRSASSNKDVQAFFDLQRELYDLPYRFVRPERVLVLGAGGGNDVAAALRAGVREVDAVEIDPVIAQLGRRLHPEHPYADPRVRLVVDDARSFLHRHREQYDLIELGFLDTLRLLSQFSSVRLDSYVYTRECFQDIRNHLNPRGMVALGFSTTTPWMLARLYGLLSETFGEEPVVYTTAAGHPAILLVRLSGKLQPIPMKHLTPVMTHPLKKLVKGGLPLPSDDWPFLYMKERAIPHHYVVVIFGTLVLAALLVFTAAPMSTTSLPWRFFFLGAAFMLLETVSITRLARSFGSTWIVTSIVILLILLTILAANTWAAHWKAIPVNGVYAALGAALLACYAYRGMATWVLCLFTGLAILFAGLIFAALFREVRSPEPAFGANILGAVAGGLLENTALVFGLQMLYVFALAFYVASYLAMRDWGRITPALRPQ